MCASSDAGPVSGTRLVGGGAGMADPLWSASGAPSTSGSVSVRALQAGQWRVASTAVQGVLQLVVGIVLARLLPPADFGLAALALVVIGFATMVSDVGVGAAVVQRPTLTASHLRVAFTISMVSSLGIAAALLLFAPAIGLLARSSAVTPVLRVQSALFVAMGVGTVAQALLQRELNFRRLFIIDLISYLLGYALIAIGGALLGWGVWSLIIGSLVQSTLASVLSLIAVRAPVRPLIAACELRELLGFGTRVTVNGLVAYVGRNGDNFLVGRMLGAIALGLYSRAFNFMMLPINYLSSVLPQVLIPAFSEIQTDRARVGRGYLLGVQATVMATAPVMVGIIVAAPHLIQGVYGDRWAGAVLPLQILAAVGVPRALLFLAGAVARACNRVGSEVPLQIGFALAVTVGTAVGSRHGLPGVALFVSMAIVLMSLAQAGLALSITGATWRGFATAHVPGILLGLFLAATTVPLRLLAERAGLSHLPILLLLVATSAASVLVGLYLMPSAIRPKVLFRHLGGSIGRVPAVLRRPLLRVLGVAT